MVKEVVIPRQYAGLHSSPARRTRVFSPVSALEARSCRRRDSYAGLSAAQHGGATRVRGPGRARFVLVGRIVPMRKVNVCPLYAGSLIFGSSEDKTRGIAPTKQTRPAARKAKRRFVREWPLAQRIQTS
mgnify:CR=1 FL=1